MSWKEFFELCQVKASALRIWSRHDNLEKVEIRRRALAHCHHHIGEVIFFEDSRILDCEWFWWEVLTQLVKFDCPSQASLEKNVCMPKKELDRTLEKMFTKSHSRHELFGNFWSLVIG